MSRFLRYDLMQGCLGIITIAAIPQAIKWLSPINTPVLSQGIDTHAVLSTAAGVFVPNTAGDAFLSVAPTRALYPAIDTSTGTALKTSNGTVYKTVSVTVRATQPSLAGSCPVTIYTGHTRGLAAQRSPALNEKSRGTNSRGESYPPRSKKSTTSEANPNPAVSDLVPEADWKSMLLTLCGFFIVILFYVINQRTGQPWIRQLLEEIERRKAKLRQAIEELEEARKETDSVETTLQYTIEEDAILMESRRKTLERAKKALKFLTKFKIALLGLPEEDFQAAFDVAVTAKDRAKRERADLIAKKKGYARNLSSLKADMMAKEAVIAYYGFRDGRSNQKQLQRAQDREEDALLQYQMKCETEIKSLATELEKVTQERNMLRQQLETAQTRLREHIINGQLEHATDWQPIATMQSFTRQSMYRKNAV